MFLLWIIEENALGGGVLARFVCPRGGGLNSFAWGESLPIKKFPMGFSRGGMIRLGID